MNPDNLIPVSEPKIGQRVTHNVLGTGTIVGVYNSEHSYLVKFDRETNDGVYRTHNGHNKIYVSDKEDCWWMSCSGSEPRCDSEIAYYTNRMKDMRL